MRLFTALDPSPAVHEQLRQLLDHLRPAARLRWTRPENLHLTLKFIGEWPAERFPALQDALRAIPVPAGMEVAFSGLGFFPNARAPRVFWVGVRPSSALQELAGSIDGALEPLGIAPEKRSYSPHLTLARIQDRTRLDALDQAIQALPSLEFGSFTADRFYLYESRLAPGGSIYTRLAEFPRAL